MDVMAFPVEKEPIFLLEHKAMLVGEY